MEKYFNKRVYNLRLLLGDILFLLRNLFELNNLRKNKDINKIFQEKIMNIVSCINGCVYCKWFHAKQAIKAGISADEIKQIMEMQFETSATDYELKGLLFAQHYAETNRNPDTIFLNELNTFYGEKNAGHIILTIRMIYFGNLYGNTLDAFISRLKGVKAKNSSLLFELWFFLNNFPVYIILRLTTNK